VNLLIDVGNSRLKWAFCDADNWQTGSGTVSGTGFAEVLNNISKDLSAPEKVIIASVADEARVNQINKWVDTNWSLSPVWLSAQRQQLGVSNCYQKPETLGADRWAAIIAAHSLSSKHVVLIDCGTAVTIDILLANGEFDGGIIFPGLSMMRRSLIIGTSNIQSDEGDDSCIPACSTEDAVAAGTLHGWVGAILRVLDHYGKSLADEKEIIVTGGDAHKLVPFLPADTRLEPDLVLKGLSLIADDL
jgi:type III pantothenate kinase